MKTRVAILSGAAMAAAIPSSPLALAGHPQHEAFSAFDSPAQQLAEAPERNPRG